MCLIAFSWQPGSDRPLVLAANRDEFHDRPARAMGWWRWPAGPLAGRDEQAGGTWLAVGRGGRFAAVTNFRDPGAKPGVHSRGELPLAWLESGDRLNAFCRRIHDRRDQYGPFNLLAGMPEELMIVGSHAPPAPVAPGIHALSNHLLDTPWPKSIRSCRLLEKWLAANGPAPLAGLLDLLDDREPAPPHELPDTGVGDKIERLLSAPFIVSADYGTRSSTALVIGPRIRAAERVFGPSGHVAGEIHFGWRRPD